MPTKQNDLFVGADLIDVEGAGIKHTGTIREYGLWNLNNVKKTGKDFTGLDFETDTKTGDIMLIGQYEIITKKQAENDPSKKLVEGEERYKANYGVDFVNTLYHIVRNAFQSHKNIAYWRKLDLFVQFKTLAYRLAENERMESLKRFGRIPGRYQKKKNRFDPGYPPVVSVKVGDNSEFGILAVIKSSINFYFLSSNGFFGTVWAYDIEPLYESTLEKQAKLHLPYYEKGEEELHKIDWERFNADPEFKARVIRSNYFDSRAAFDLAKIVEGSFSKAFFGYYPSSLISAGALARSSIVACAFDEYKGVEDIKERRAKVLDDVSSISMVYHTNQWKTDLGVEKYKDLMCMISESYTGAYIETLGYGIADSCYMADIASDYPDKAMKLWDLRGAKITYGKGEPPNIPYSYCLIRGNVYTPETLNFNPITSKHPIHKHLNIRANGYYPVTYSKVSRDYVKARGGSFSNEEWFNIETTGKPNFLSTAVKKQLKIRADSIVLYGKDSAEEIRAKKSANSCYGLTYQATPIYEMNEDGKVVCVGLRCGESYNALLASTITDTARIHICDVAEQIEKNGGKVITIMTDSVFFIGGKEVFPVGAWKPEKTVGYFEEPEELRHFICLGAGRYEYTKYNKETKKWDSFKSKTRGFDIPDLLAEDGVTVSRFNWKKGLQLAKENGTTKIKMTVRVLVSVGLVLNSRKYPFEMLGKIIDEEREVDIIAGKEKRVIRMKGLAERIQKEIVYTEPYFWEKGAFEGYDMTLPFLRKHVFNLNVLTEGEKKKELSIAKNKRKWENIKDEYMRRYFYCKSRGENSRNANKTAKTGWKGIQKKYGLSDEELTKVVAFTPEI